MKSLSTVIVLAATVVLFAPSADASIIFSTTLNGGAEVPANASTALGSAVVVLENDNITLDVLVNYFGLSAGATASHLHCCTTPGNSAPVALPLTGFPTTSTGFYAHTFDLASSLAGTTPGAFRAGLSSGKAYVNIHDSRYPGGEIRGFLAPMAETVPEPATIALSGLALIALAAGLRRRASFRR